MGNSAIIKYMARQRTNKIWSIPLEVFSEVCKQSKTLHQIIKEFELSGDSGWTYRNIKARIKQDNIDISHITLGRGHNKGKKSSATKSNLEELLVENSCGKRNTIKNRLISERILEPNCSECKIGLMWNNKPIVLHLDHINGINNDNRIENLRLLCPNCHSQTDTYCGRNNKKILKKDCSDCGVEISLKKTKCIDCIIKFKTKELKIKHTREHKTKIQWPTKEELEKLVWEISTLQLAKKLGVSDKSIEKRCKKFGISKPPKGYWAKIKTTGL